MTDNMYQYNPDISDPKPFDEEQSEFATLDTVFDNAPDEFNAIQDNTIESINDKKKKKQMNYWDKRRIN